MQTLLSLQCRIVYRKIINNYSFINSDINILKISHIVELLYVIYSGYILQMLPLQTNIKLAYQGGTDDEQNFIQNLSLFLCTFLKEHAQLLEKKAELHPLLKEVRFKDVSI